MSENKTAVAPVKLDLNTEIVVFGWFAEDVGIPIDVINKRAKSSSSKSREIELDEMLNRLLAFIKNNELIYYARKTSDIDLYYKKQLENKIRLFLYKLSYSNPKLMRILTKDESFINKILDTLVDDIVYKVKPSIHQYIPYILTVLQKNIINMDIPHLNNKVIYASIKEVLPDDKLLFDTNLDKIIEANQNYILETIMESTS